MNKLVILNMILALSLSGCAVMSKSECQNANWELIGQRDGISGAGSLSQARGQACAKHQINMNRKQYLDGYRKGIQTYCTPQTVFDYALSGKGNYQNCPLEMHTELRPYYNVAANYYAAKSKLESIENTLASARKNLNQAEKKESRDYYRGQITESSELLPQARRNFDEAQRSLELFKREKY